MPRAYTPADAKIASTLRSLRAQKGMSQQALGKKIGMSLQQIQKYESGVNRVSAGTLVEIAAALGTPILSFFEPVELELDSNETHAFTVMAKLYHSLTPERKRLARDFMRTMIEG